MNAIQLTTPISINSVNFPNRIVMPPLVIWQSDESAEVKDNHLKHYASCAGPGLVIVEATVVSPEGRLKETQLGIFEDRHIEGLKLLADVIRNGGGVPGIQIHHAGGKSKPEFTYGLTPLVPSKNALPEDKICREMTVQDIKEIQNKFAEAAYRAEQAGFEYIELHGAHGYLICQFLSPLTNKRTDEYGGSLENRLRMLMETFAATKRAVSPNTIVSCRLGVADQDPAGLSLEEGIATAKRLVEAGIPMLDISCAHNAPESVVPEGSSYSPLLHLAAAVKKEVSIPVIGVGGIKSAENAQVSLNDGMADMIAAGKGLLADPEWATKAIASRGSDINECIGCKICFCFKDLNLCPVRKKTLDWEL